MRYLILVFALFLWASNLHAQGVQYAWNYHEDAGNPNRLFQWSDGSFGLNGSYDVALQGPIYNNRWSDVIPLPFAFEFYGNPVTHVRASTDGLVTMDTLDTGLINGNTNLPQAAIPSQSISVFWDLFVSFPTPYLM